jgi:hypothetical protein
VEGEEEAGEDGGEGRRHLPRPGGAAEERRESGVEEWRAAGGGRPEGRRAGRPEGRRDGGPAGWRAGLPLSPAAVLGGRGARLKRGGLMGEEGMRAAGGLPGAW